MNFFLSGLQKLEQRAKKCIELLTFLCTLMFLNYELPYTINMVIV